MEEVARELEVNWGDALESSASAGTVPHNSQPITVKPLSLHSHRISSSSHPHTISDSNYAHMLLKMWQLTRSVNAAKSWETPFANFARQPWETPFPNFASPPLSNGVIVMKDDDEEPAKKAGHPISLINQR